MSKDFVVIFYNNNNYNNNNSNFFFKSILIRKDLCTALHLKTIKTKFVS